MNAHPCTDCGITVDGTIGAVRLVGREQLDGRVVALCPRCYLKRGEDARPITPATTPRRR
jgi:hypothetical protein